MLCKTLQVTISLPGPGFEIIPYHHRGTATVIKELAEASPEGSASHLMHLALLFTQRQLEVQKAFADLDEHRSGSIAPAQLVCSHLLLGWCCASIIASAHPQASKRNKWTALVMTPS